MTIKCGDLISLSQKPGGTYQVVNIDEFSDCVWVRRWPLASQLSPTFAVPTNELRTEPAQNAK
jgi:hypothetical protein